VPPLFGLTEEQAREQLRAAGLEPSLRFEPSDQQEGTVIDADPPPGSQVPAGSTITLVISTGPTAAPTTSPPVSPSPGG
jgi:serine/threonine-protein kinase